MCEIRFKVSFKFEKLSDCKELLSKYQVNTWEFVAKHSCLQMQKKLHVYSCWLPWVCAVLKRQPHFQCPALLSTLVLAWTSFSWPLIYWLHRRIIRYGIAHFNWSNSRTAFPVEACAFQTRARRRRRRIQFAAYQYDSLLSKTFPWTTIPRLEK